MTDTIHHSIREYLPAKLLLIRQWVERINMDRALLMARIEDARFGNDERALSHAEHDYQTWLKRLSEDVNRESVRLQEDGYTALRTWTINVHDPNTPTDSLLSDDCAFMPVTRELVEIGRINHALVWIKQSVLDAAKVVQS